MFHVDVISILLLLASFFTASEQAEGAESKRIVVTFTEYNACQRWNNAPEAWTSCAQMAKCYGRRLVLDVSLCFGQRRDLDTNELEAFAQQEQGVAEIEWDTFVYSSQQDWMVESMDSNDSVEVGVKQQWNMDLLDVYEIWKNKSRGEQSTIALLDSGIAQSALEAFQGRILPGYDFISDIAFAKDGDGRDPDFYDPGDADAIYCPGQMQDSWHGTSVASIAAANYSGFYGVAPASSILPVRVLGRCKTGYASDVADAIVWTAGGIIERLNETSPMQRHTNSFIIIMAFAGLGSCPSFIQTAVDIAVAHNITLYSAAGNDENFFSSDFFPSNCRGVVSIGALTKKSQIAPYSSIKADAFMPGGDTENPILCLGANLSRIYLCSGTSAAVSHAGGLVALDPGGIRKWITEQVDNGYQWPRFLNNPSDFIQGMEFVPYKAVSVTGGVTHTCALLVDGNIKCWGSNSNYALGDGTVTQRTSPVAVKNLTGISVQIATGSSVTCSLMKEGSTKCWGTNTYGKTGRGDTVNIFARSPTNVQNATESFVQIAGVMDHFCVLGISGGVFCWGRNLNGWLGNNKTVDSGVPVSVMGLRKNVTSVANGHSHSCAVLHQGGMQCWGLNTVNQIGDGTLTPRFTAVDVNNMQNTLVIQACGGYGHTCALISGGTMKCWGRNNVYQLGDGTVTQRTSPVNVVGLGANASAIACGYQHTCALLSSGVVQCWGGNEYGQIGDNTTTNRVRPVNVSGLTEMAVSIGAGHYHTCVVLISGSVMCWGRNQNGQTGNGTTTATGGIRTPVIANIGMQNICPAGTYLGDISTNVCLDCANGKYSNVTGATSSSTCIATSTQAPTPEPTPSPTPVPTSEPTPVPTSEPTPVPTSEPTPVPTSEPTPVPTSEPTPVPTPEPTPSPTAAPTPVPTPEPTPSPTAAPTAAPTPVNCALSQPWMKSSADGSSCVPVESLEEIVVCQAGQIVNADRTGCESCPPGKISESGWIMLRS
jgi:alpha-tubulin suppressor-like RCC1 family protein